MTPTRWAAVLCLLACTASAQRLDRLQRRLDRRDRLGGAGGPQPLLLMSFVGDCEGAATTGLTYSRNSPETCHKTDGTLVTLAAGQPVQEADGLLVDVAMDNLLLQPTNFTTTGWATSFGGGVASAPTLTSLGNNTWQVDFTAVSGTGSYQALAYTLATMSGTRTASVEVQACSGSADTYLALWDGAATYYSVPCRAVSSRWTNCSVDAAVLASATWQWVLGTDLRDTAQAATSATCVKVRMPQVEAAPQPSRALIAKAGNGNYSRFPQAATVANPVTSNRYCWVWSGTYREGMALRPTPRTLAATGTNQAANSAKLYTANGGGVYFDVYDSAGTLRQMGLGVGAGGAGATIAVCNDNGALTGWIDGRVTEYPPTLGGTGTALFSTFPTTIRLGAATNGTGEANASTRSFCVSTTPEGCGANTPALSYHACPTCPAAQQVAALGDSITHGQFAPTRPWPRWLQKLQGGGWGVDNFGISGTRVDQMLSRWRSRIRGQGWGALVVEGGVNDFQNGRDATQAWADMQVLLDEARADGLKVVPMTVLPWGTYVNWTAARQTDTDTFNSNLLAYCATWGLTCVDAYALMGEPGTPTRLRVAYDSGDGIHPNAAGNAVLAEAVRAALLP